MNKEDRFLIQGKEAASDEEYYFYFWCLALMDLGYIKNITFQPKSFNLLPKQEYLYIKHMKTKIKLSKNTLLNPHTYQADYVIEWHLSAHHIFFEFLNGEENNKPKNDVILLAQYHKDKIISVIDTKGGMASKFARNNSTVITFPINQKLVYHKYGIYVNKVVPFNSSEPKKCLFSKTFAPNEYLYRKKKVGKGYLKVNCIAKTLTEFLNK